MKDLKVRKFAENDSFEFYQRCGTHSDARDVQKFLKEHYGKVGTLLLDSVYGWIVRVEK